MVVGGSKGYLWRADWKSQIKRCRVSTARMSALRDGAIIGSWILWGAQVPH